MSEEKAPSPPQPALSWLDQAVAEARAEIERIHSDARAVLDEAFSEPVPVVHVPEQPGSRD